MSYNPALSKEARNITNNKNYRLCLIYAVQWQENKQIRNLDKISLDGTIGEGTDYTIIFKISVKQNQNKSV